jgi:hypothetical protein
MKKRESCTSSCGSEAASELQHPSGGKMRDSFQRFVPEPLQFGGKHHMNPTIPSTECAT